MHWESQRTCFGTHQFPQSVTIGRTKKHRIRASYCVDHDAELVTDVRAAESNCADDSAPDFEDRDCMDCMRAAIDAQSRSVLFTASAFGASGSAPLPAAFFAHGGVVDGHPVPRPMVDTLSNTSGSSGAPVPLHAPFKLVSMSAGPSATGPRFGAQVVAARSFGAALCRDQAAAGPRHSATRSGPR